MKQKMVMTLEFAYSDLWCKLYPAQAASQGWCAETGHERLLTQVGLFSVFSASSYLEFELLMLSVVCGLDPFSWYSWRRRGVVLAMELSQGPELCSPFSFLSSLPNLIHC